jgi:hypothetical protein
MSVSLKVFLISLIAFVLIYLLRGFRIVTFLPGGILLVLLLIALCSGLIWGIKKTRRF